MNITEPAFRDLILAAANKSLAAGHGLSPSDLRACGARGTASRIRLIVAELVESGEIAEPDAEGLRAAQQARRMAAKAALALGQRRPATRRERCRLRPSGEEKAPKPADDVDPLVRDCRRHRREYWSASRAIRAYLPVLERRIEEQERVTCEAM